MIRPYETRDFEDCLYLQQVCYTKPCTESELREKLSTGKCWVWEDDPLVVGCVIISDVLIWSVTVAPNWRRKGIAWHLLSEAEYSCRGGLWLYTEPDSPAHKLYRRRGYKEVTRVPHHYGQDSPAVFMVKR